MTDYQELHIPCPSCPSSDGYTTYLDGGGHCFVCKYHRHAPSRLSEDGHPEGPNDVSETETTADDKQFPTLGGALLEGEAQPLIKRKISLETCEKFGYIVSGNVQAATYCDAKGRAVAQKVRGAGKAFKWVGSPKHAVLFGQQLWTPGGKKIVVTEGEIDALSMSQAQGNQWPVVSLPNGAPAAVKDLAKHLEYLESFEEIILMFDQDAPGQAAADACAPLFSAGKVKVARLPLKDPNEMLVAGRTKELIDAMWRAKPWRPQGIVEGVDVLDAVMEKPEPGLSYPWHCLQPALHGMRTGEMVTVAAGTGIGKSQFCRELARHLWVGHKERVGIIALEEGKVDSALGQISLELDRPLHLPSVRDEVGEEAIRGAGEHILPGFVLYDHFGSVDPKVLLPKIRYMAKALGIRWFVLDHISIMVSGQAEEGDERKRIDALVTKLKTMIMELDVGLVVVTHLRKAAGTPHEEGGHVSGTQFRGSGAIYQMTNIGIGLERNPQAEDGSENEITLRCIKNRFSGRQGIIGQLVYNNETGRITEPPDDPGLPDYTQKSVSDQEDF